MSIWDAELDLSMGPLWFGCHCVEPVPTLVYSMWSCQPTGYNDGEGTSPHAHFMPSQPDIAQMSAPGQPEARNTRWRGVVG
jgi:hypothetical protein